MIRFQSLLTAAALLASCDKPERTADPHAGHTLSPAGTGDEHAGQGRDHGGEPSDRDDPDHQRAGRLFQEYRAERSVLALRAMTAPQAKVVRDGHQAVVAAAAVVPGDILLLEADDVVADDARLLEANRLTANEAALTGESMPVDKRLAATDPSAWTGRVVPARTP